MQLPKVILLLNEGPSIMHPLLIKSFFYLCNIFQGLPIEIALFMSSTTIGAKSLCMIVEWEFIYHASCHTLSFKITLSLPLQKGWDLGVQINAKLFIKIIGPSVRPFVTVSSFVNLDIKSENLIIILLFDRKFFLLKSCAYNI